MTLLPPWLLTLWFLSAGERSISYTQTASKYGGIWSLIRGRVEGAHRGTQPANLVKSDQVSFVLLQVGTVIKVLMLLSPFRKVRSCMT